MADDSRRRTPLRVVLPSVFLLLTPCLAANACLDLPAVFPCALDHTCPDEYECTAAGTCAVRPTCASGNHSCNATCVDLQTDALHCGGCASACESASSCCSGACKDTASDVGNCGACDNQCDLGFTCAEGNCNCDSPKTACRAAGAEPAECVDTDKDPKHCGSCRHACKSGAICTGGTCKCPKSTIDCPDACADLQNDVGNCGACGTSCKRTGVDATCSRGTCRQVCSAGRVDCDDDVTNGCEGQNPGGGTCSIFPAGCGCQAGQACVRTTAASAEQCIVSQGLGLLATCSAKSGAIAAPCASGLICVGSVCQPACETKADCSNGTYGKCTEAEDANGKPVAGELFCTRSCRPDAPTTADATHEGCGSNQNCIPSTTGTTYCAGNPAGVNAGAGQACDDSTRCVPGYVCSGSSSNTTCRPYCRVGKSTCPGQKACSSFAPKGFDGAEEIGYCPAQ